MKIAWLLPIAVLGSTLSPKTSDTLHAVPVTGEPHHHLKIENSYVRVFYVEVAPHENTLLHEHAVDYLFTSLGPADVTNAVLGKPDAHLVLKDTEMHFTRGGFAHVARNLSDQAFRNVTIELLRPQGQPHNRCEKVLASEERGSCMVQRRGYAYSISPWFETDEIHVEYVELQPKAIFQDVPGTDDLIVALNEANLNIQFPSMPDAKLSAGGVLWLKQGGLEKLSNANEQPSRFLRIHFKDSASRH